MSKTANTASRKKRLVRRPCVYRQKRAFIIAPIPGEDRKEWRWLCITIKGNLKWDCTTACDSEEDAKRWVKTMRKHLRQFNDLEVCSRLASHSPAACYAAALYTPEPEEYEEVQYCAGCSQRHPCKSDCPCGTYTVRVKKPKL